MVLLLILQFQANVNDWIGLYGSIGNMIKIKEICSLAHVGEVEIFQKVWRWVERCLPYKIQTGVQSCLYMIAQAINGAIDFDRSKEESRLVIREGKC